MENQRYGLSEGQCCHQPVDLKHTVPANKQTENVYYTSGSKKVTKGDLFSYIAVLVPVFNSN